MESSVLLSLSASCFNCNNRVSNKFGLTANELFLCMEVTANELWMDAFLCFTAMLTDALLYYPSEL